MRKRMLSLLLCLCMAATLLTPTAWAADDAAASVEIGSVRLSAQQPYYKNGDKAGSVTGNEENWNAKFEDGTLTLRNLNASSRIYCSSGLLEIVLEDGTTNRILPALEYAQTSTVAIQAVNLSISGSGKLECRGNRDAGIRCNDNLTIEGSSEVYIWHSDDPVMNVSGIQCDTLRIISEATVTVEGGFSTGSIYGISVINDIEIDNATVVSTPGDGDMGIVGIASLNGNITINGGKVTATGGLQLPATSRTRSYGISCKSLRISGGAEVTATGNQSSGNSYGISCTGPITVEGNSTVQCTGGTVTGRGTSSGIQCSADKVTIDHSDVTVTSGSSNDASEAIRATQLEVNGSTLTATSCGDGITVLPRSQPSGSEANFTIVDSTVSAIGNGTCIVCTGMTVTNSTVSGKSVETAKNRSGANGIGVIGALLINSGTVTGIAEGKGSVGVTGHAITVISGELNGTGTLSGIDSYLRDNGTLTIKGGKVTGIGTDPDNWGGIRSDIFQFECPFKYKTAEDEKFTKVETISSSDADDLFSGKSYVCIDCNNLTDLGEGDDPVTPGGDDPVTPGGDDPVTPGGDTPVAPPAPSYPVLPPYADDVPGSTSTANPGGNKPGEDKKEEPAVPVTTTVTDPQTGAVTETTTNPDGSSVAVVTQPDGASATIATAPSGQVSAAVTLPAAAISAAQNSGEALVLPIPEVQATRSAATAPTVTVNTGSSQPVKVEIPTANAAPGTVAVLVKADGTEEVIKTSVSTADGVAVSLPDGATVKIVDNSKDFGDVSAQHWAGDAVDFVTARELFSGTSETAFTPDAPMTRAMLATVLARLDGADTDGGETWYEKGVAWAVAHDISDGSDPDGNITREQLAVMLWRYAGAPAPGGALSDFADAEEVSGYAQQAMRWAVEAGVISGLGNGQLAPQGQATRAQVAQMLMNFISR